jgi:XTP/dITP diphosphohydrolase
VKILLATNNRNKGEEIISIWGERDNIEFLFPSDLGLKFSVIEDGATFPENAYKKAILGLKLSGLPTIGEDSGLLVDYLKGEPGVKSNRFAGEKASFEANIKKVLEKLKGVPRDKRKACFVCVICFALSFKKVLFFEGKCFGSIAHYPKGKEGFGYDPIFIPRGFKKTFAELGGEVKNKISHRKEAVMKLKKYLEEMLGRKNERDKTG